ncbi:putative HXXXD-type acyl-transferase family protein [Heracleum sosnowskyi]|uniref:HXXXD-type acyl-transferase family protein n=1 Tax=Heracleum sosnowskyi TaxID=360622 RepID=A0AAD8HXG1_9APIA|nr:putative HXXXD-type acyl-transferase family protein [Heracleum sosnowskyi]
MESQIIGRKMIKPAVPTPDHLRICKLTFFDQFAPVDHIPFMQFYKANSSEQGENVQAKLLKSLSETLVRFYPLAGRYIEDGWYIDCNDMGAEYIESKINVELDEFLSIAPKNMHLLDHHLVARDNLKAISNLATTPILCLKVSTFNCGGTAICTHLSHKVVDGFTAATFFREWSSTCKSDTMITRQVVFPPQLGFDKLFSTRDIPDAIKQKPGPSQEKLVAKTFVFNEEAISKIKSRLAHSIDITQPTRVEAVTCTVLKAIVSATKSTKDVLFYCPVNVRGRSNLVKQVDENSLLCGNYCIPVAIKIIRDTAGNKKILEVQDLVSLTRSRIPNVLDLCSKSTNPDDLFLETATNLGEIKEDIGKGEQVDTVFFSSLCRFPFYEADFGWGKPEWVTTGGMTLQLAFFMDTKSGTGISAMVCLQEERMLQFECDPDIVAFTS